MAEGISCYIEFTLHKEAFLNVGKLHPTITAALTITLALNFIATGNIVLPIGFTVLSYGSAGLIIWKIQSCERLSQTIGRQSDDVLRHTMRIIIESGLLFAIAVLVFFIVYLCSNNAQYGVSDCVSSFSYPVE